VYCTEAPSVHAPNQSNMLCNVGCRLLCQCSGIDSPVVVHLHCVWGKGCVLHTRVSLASSSFDSSKDLCVAVE